LKNPFEINATNQTVISLGCVYLRLQLSMPAFVWQIDDKTPCGMLRRLKRTLQRFVLTQLLG
jgi:hypothetical protein